jgi:hypothetical protein
MAVAKSGAGAARARPKTAALPVVRVARFEEVAKLIERLVEEKQDVFLAAAQRFRARHRDATSRGLDYAEAAQVAAAMVGGEPDVTLAEQVQASELRAYDEPSPNEMLVAAGVATAPAFIEATKRVAALIELDDDVFRDARENDTLDEAIDAYVRDTFDELAMDEARQRAYDALEHYAKAAGQGSLGEAVGLLTRLVGQAFQQAMLTLAPTLQGSPSSSLTGSPPSTNGDGAKSSTSSPTSTP